MFSTRTSWDLACNRLTAAVAARQASGLEIVDLTQSNPTEAGLVCPADLLQLLANPRGRVYGPAARGLPAAREAVASDYARRGFSVSSDRIILTASTSEAYALLFKLLCDPGDRVLVPRPSYPLFQFLADLECVGVDRYALGYDGEWHVSVDALAERITPRTRAVVVVSPNNPTGSFLKVREADRLLDLCARRGLALIADEVFADFEFGPPEGRLRSVASDGPALAFSLGGLSKSCGLPQLKLGWLAAFGPRAQREQALARLEVVADTYLSVSTPVQLALPEILDRIPELQSPITERLRSNLGAVRRSLASLPSVSLLDVEGGWSATLRIAATIPEEERVLRLVETAGVLVHPGYFFDFSHEAHLVLSLLTPPETLNRGIAALAADLGPDGVL